MLYSQLSIKFRGHMTYNIYRGSALRLASGLLALLLLTACSPGQPTTRGANITGQQELATPAPTNTARSLPSPTTAPTAPPPTAAPTEAPVVATAEAGINSSQTTLNNDLIIADARVVPLQHAALSFGTSGVIVEILVQEGQTVQEGQIIARLDTRTIEARIADATAAVADAEANLQRVQARVTQQDIAAARAELERARAALARLRSGPDQTEVRIAQANLDRAQANLQRERDRLSVAKNKAELELTKAADALRNAQDAYNIIYWENRRKSDLDPEERAREEAALREVKAAEATLDQAKLDFELAQKAEITGIEAAETEVHEAKAELERLLAGPKPDAIAAAQADVARAEAHLASLTGPAREAEIAEARARLQQRTAYLQEARLQLDEATLRAPFDGIIAASDLLLGQRAVANEVVVSVANTEEWRVETRDLVELDAVRFSEGAPVVITFDALPGLELPGSVERIRPAGDSDQVSDYTTYIATIRPHAWDPRILWNMTATVVISVP